MFEPKSPRNILLAAMRAEDADALLARSEHAELNVYDMLERPNVPITHVYFPENGVVSVVVTAPDGRQIEAGVIGREGMTGLSATLSSDRSPHRTFVQMKGAATRVDVDTFRSVLDGSPHLRQIINRYSHALNTQIAYTALANAKATIEERLARWLLMCEDRIGTPDLRLTHEFLSLMLGARRPGVTDALHILEGKHFIKSIRGVCTVIDRKGLIDLVGGIYGVPEAEYERLIRAATRFEPSPTEQSDTNRPGIEGRTRRP